MKLIFWIYIILGARIALYYSDEVIEYICLNWWDSKDYMKHAIYKQHQESWFRVIIIVFIAFFWLPIVGINLLRS